MLHEAINHEQIARHANTVYNVWEDTDPQQTGPQKHYDVNWDLGALHQMARVPLKTGNVTIGGQCPRLAPLSMLSDGDAEIKAHRLSTVLFSANAEFINPIFAECMTAIAIMSADDVQNDLGPGHTIVSTFKQSLLEAGLSTSEVQTPKQRLLLQCIRGQVEACSERKLGESGLQISSSSGANINFQLKQSAIRQQAQISEIGHLRAEVANLQHQILQISRQCEQARVQSESRHAEMMKAIRYVVNHPALLEPVGEDRSDPTTLSIPASQIPHHTFDTLFANPFIDESISENLPNLNGPKCGYHKERNSMESVTFPKEFLSVKNKEIHQYVTAWFDPESGLRQGMSVDNKQKVTRVRSEVRSMVRFVCRFLPSIKLPKLPDNYLQRALSGGPDFR